ncbi:4'-phosphopantetheinyl transferase superfamily protein [Chryseolinea serpens]|uniref:4'-phosphopantetheinyl transferase superfamily protein n=1 Tax=Chryseolinea serpens TaxID=947013 RepID=A0A1M5WM15_9BACT|nr:4'-phosphopantetheinyl transferase superfamily protein [Chryseolinea serpens]SHH88537.1 4'-phosphopantetheinyl transferase superfamily protein [Chryseolinea serpens]
MPLEKIVQEPGRAWALWRISETESELSAQVLPYETVPDTLVHPNKRLEFLAGRVLVKTIMEKMNLSFQGITKDEFGKPSPRGLGVHLSLSHSYPYAGALLDLNQPVGIDLEQPKDKLFRIAPRVFGPEELQDAGTSLAKHCIYWCAKEALLKVYGKKDLVFSENLLISPFREEMEGDIRGRIIVKDSVTMISLHYIVYPNFVVVFNQSEKI